MKQSRVLSKIFGLLVVSVFAGSAWAAGYKFEVFRSPKDKQFYFHLKASNGQIMLASEGYKNRGGANNGIDSLMRNATTLRAVVAQAKNGQWYFTWTAANYKVTGVSETYVTKGNAIRGAEAVARVLATQKPTVVEKN
jgi:uncharacterized protein YegP (UPF0339 family)